MGKDFSHVLFFYPNNIFHSGKSTDDTLVVHTAVSTRQGHLNHLHFSIMHLVLRLTADGNEYLLLTTWSWLNLTFKGVKLQESVYMSDLVAARASFCCRAAALFLFSHLKIPGMGKILQHKPALICLHYVTITIIITLTRGNQLKITTHRCAPSNPNVHSGTGDCGSYLVWSIKAPWAKPGIDKEALTSLMFVYKSPLIKHIREETDELYPHGEIRFFPPRLKVAAVSGQQLINQTWMCPCHAVGVRLSHL